MGTEVNRGLAGGMIATYERENALRFSYQLVIYSMNYLDAIRIASTIGQEDLVERLDTNRIHNTTIRVLLMQKRPHKMFSTPKLFACGPDEYCSPDGGLTKAKRC